MRWHFFNFSLLVYYHYLETARYLRGLLMFKSSMIFSCEKGKWQDMKEKYHHLKFKYEVGNFYNRILPVLYDGEESIKSTYEVAYHALEWAFNYWSYLQWCTLHYNTTITIHLIRVRVGTRRSWPSRRRSVGWSSLCQCFNILWPYAVHQ